MAERGQAQEMEQEAEKASASKTAKRAEAAKKKIAQVAAAQAAANVAVGLDRRKKSRNKQVAENAAKSAEVTPPLGHSLRTMEPNTVAQMAAAPIEPDWEDNPAHLDTPTEVREDLRDDGLDPMDVNTPQRAAFGHSLIHGMANDPDRGGRTPAQLEAEHDMVVEAMTEDYGMDHDSPLDLAGITNGAMQGDPFGVSIDLSMGGER
jgi:hypothetical protein